MKVKKTLKLHDLKIKFMKKSTTDLMNLKNNVTPIYLIVKILKINTYKT